MNHVSSSLPGQTSLSRINGGRKETSCVIAYLCDCIYETEGRYSMIRPRANLPLSTCVHSRFPLTLSVVVRLDAIQ